VPKGQESSPLYNLIQVDPTVQRNVVTGKIIKVAYFQEQGLEVFWDKLRAEGWLELFTNTQLGCFMSDLAEFYANCFVTQGVVTGEVNGKKMCFAAKKLPEILGVPATRFDIYV